MPHSCRSAKALPTASAIAPSRGYGLRRGLQARQPVGADAGHGARPAPARPRRALRRRHRRQAVPERPQPAARLFGGAQVGGARGGARGDEGVAPVDGVELLPDAAQLVDVVRGVERLERQRAQQALRGRLREALVLGQQARGLQRLQRLPASRAACSFRRSAWVRRATPGGSSPSSSQRTRRVAVVERPFGGEQARALFGRPRRRRLRRASSARAAAARRAPARSCRRCGLPAASRWPSTRELVVLRQLAACRPGSPARAAPPSARGCSGRRSTAPARRAARPARCGRAAPRAIRAPAAAG